MCLQLQWSIVWSLSEAPQPLPRQFMLPTLSQPLVCSICWNINSLIAAITAGVLMVTVLLTLNMIVAIGMLNGFIFYANVVAANSTIFIPSSEPSFTTVFVAWVNLDIGVNVCFIVTDGLD